MSAKSEPWYIHAVLYLIIVGLIYLLIRVAIVEPTSIVEKEKYYKLESRARMLNLREAEILWQQKHGRFTDKLDNLVEFIKFDSVVIEKINSIDTLTGKSSNPFVNLTSGKFIPDSLFKSPKSGNFYAVQVDTSTNVDTIIDRRGRLIKVDTVITIGTRYLVGCPDGYGKIGDLFSDALKNTASWE